MTDALKALAIGCAVIIGIALVIHGNRPGPAPIPEPAHTSAPLHLRAGDLPDIPWPPPSHIRQPSVREQIDDALAAHDRREHQRDIVERTRLLPGLRPIH